MGHKGSGCRRLTYANVTSTIALMIAVSGGTAFAASHLITGKQIAKGTITSANIKSHSLLASNFKKEQIPQPGRPVRRVRPEPLGPRAPGAARSPTGTWRSTATETPQFNATLTKGFTSASSPSAGVYCIPYPPGVSTNIPLAISDSGNETAQWNQVANGQCGGSGYEIANITSAQGLSGGGLNIAIP